MLLQTQHPSLRPLTTAHLAQTMTLLVLTSDELRQKIDATLASNPALELLEESRCPHCRRILPPSGPCPSCSAPHKIGEAEPIVFVSPRQDFAPPRKHLSTDDLPSEEWTAAVEDLPTYVLRQIAPEIAPEDRVLAAHLLTCLNEDGLLSVTLSEIARYHHVALGRVQSVQRLIQRSDPLGVGSSSPQEALKSPARSAFGNPSRAEAGNHSDRAWDGPVKPQGLFRTRSAPSYSYSPGNQAGCIYQRKPQSFSRPRPLG